MTKYLVTCRCLPSGDVLMWLDCSPMAGQKKSKHIPQQCMDLEGQHEQTLFSGELLWRVARNCPLYSCNCLPDVAGNILSYFDTCSVQFTFFLFLCRIVMRGKLLRFDHFAVVEAWRTIISLFRFLWIGEIILSTHQQYLLSDSPTLPYNARNFFHERVMKDSEVELHLQLVKKNISLQFTRSVQVRLKREIILLIIRLHSTIWHWPKLLKSDSFSIFKNISAYSRFIR